MPIAPISLWRLSTKVTRPNAAEKIIPADEQLAHLVDRIGLAQLRRRQEIGKVEAQDAEDAQPPSVTEIQPLIFLRRSETPVRKGTRSRRPLPAVQILAGVAR